MRLIEKTNNFMLAHLEDNTDRDREGETEKAHVREGVI